MDLRKVQVKPFLVNSSGFDWVSGVGDVKMEFVGAGDTQLALISTLNGNGKVSIADGAIEGINIPAALRNLKAGKLPSSKKSNTEKTDFSSLIASFTIDKGVIFNKDLDVKGPLVRVNGAGAINLPREQIDYGLRPKLVGSLTGQGGRGDIAGLNIPVRLVGPLKKSKNCA